MQTWSDTVLYQMELSIVEVITALVRTMVLRVVVGLVFEPYFILQLY